MRNKEIQDQRMRGYFVQAAKEILKGEGLKSISVRKIADRAGYSYATLYNYFHDVNDLIFICVHDFYEECQSFVQIKTGKIPMGLKKINAMAGFYIDYFVQYPGIFELFFLEKVGDFGNKQDTIEAIYFALDNICNAEWKYCIEKGLIKSEEADMKKSQLRHVTTGLLLFYLNRRTPADYNEFLKGSKSSDRCDRVIFAPHQVQTKNPCPLMRDGDFIEVSGGFEPP